MIDGLGMTRIITYGFIVAMILWAFNVKFFDAFFLTLGIALAAIMARIAVPAIRARRR